jgi:protein TonB
MAAEGRTSGDQPRVVDELDGHPVYRYFKGGRVSEPERVTSASPIYPEAARRARVQGVVVLEATILPDGTVGHIRTLRSLPFGLTEAAVDAVQRWVFKPATLEGEPVAVQYVLTVRFKLSAEPKDGEINIDASGGISGKNPFPSETVDLLVGLLPDRAVLTGIAIAPDHIRARGATTNPESLASYLDSLPEAGAFDDVEILEVTTSEDPYLIHFLIRVDLSPQEAASPHPGRADT